MVKTNKVEYMKFAAARASQTSGTTAPEEGQLLKTDDAPYLHLVVVAVRPDQATVKMGVLLDRRFGLGQAFGISADEVFFFAEFQHAGSDCNSFAQRETTRQNIIKTNPNVDASARASSNKQENSQRARQTRKIVLEPNARRGKELALSPACCKRKPGRYFLDEMMQILQAANEDLNCENAHET